PILHGLCSYGVVLRTVVDELLDADVSRVRAFAARFAGVVFPGESIRVRAWDEDEQILVSATISSDTAERDGAPVLADAALTRA
ncbi:MAG: MaoC/PaaZ C-terminal domain-containing protein, partial [Nocardioidaceae bacterium]